MTHAKRPKNPHYQPNTTGGIVTLQDIVILSTRMKVQRINKKLQTDIDKIKSQLTVQAMEKRTKVNKWLCVTLDEHNLKLCAMYKPPNSSTAFLD